MRINAPILLLSTLLAFGAAAEDAAKDALAQDPKVQRAQEPQVTPEGNRPPNTLSNSDGQEAELREALAAARRAPPDANGTPVPRPNPLASEPGPGIK